MVQNGIHVELEETPARIVARCRIDGAHLASVMASLTPGSLLLLGVPHSNGQSDSFAPTLKAVPLPSLIDPQRSRAEFFDTGLLLTLEKQAGETRFG